MSERLYSLLQLLYPRAFRERYGEEMARLFRERLRDEPATRVWIDALADAAVSIPREHLIRQAHPMYPPSADPLRAAYAMVPMVLLVSALLGAVLGVLIMATYYLGLAGVVAHPWLLALAVPLPFAWLVAIRQARRISRIVKTYRYEAVDDAVTVSYGDNSPLTLQRADVTAVHDFEKAGLRIETANPARDLWVPAASASYGAIKARVSSWAPLRVTPFATFPRVSLPLVVIVFVIGLMIPVKFGGLAAGLLVAQGVSALVKREAPVITRLVPLVALAILLFKWLQ